VQRTLRILAITQNFFPDSQGGVERVAYEVMRRLVRRGHSVDLVGQRVSTDAPDVEDVSGITVHRYGTPERSRRFGGRTALALTSSRRVIGRLLSEHSYDVVLPHHFFPYYAYMRTAGPKMSPEVMTFHASYWQELRLEGAERRIGKPLESLFLGGLARRTEKACLRRSDRIVVLSEFSRDQLESLYPFAARKVVKIPGGVDLERFRPADDREALRRKLGLPADRSVVFTVRRLVPRMGLENLIAAFAEVREVRSDVLLAIAGRGRLEGELRRQADALGLGESVRFLGFVDDEALVRYYQAADLFALPTLAFEGFGMVTLEALACGTPAIGTPIGATPEILSPLARQLVLDGTEPSAIRRGILAMLEWLSDRVAAADLRRRSREYVVANFGWDRAIDAIEDLIDEVLTAWRQT